MHLARRLEMPVCGPLATKADVVDRAAFPDAGEHVLKDPAVGVMEEDIIGDHRLHAERGGEFGQKVEPQLLAGATPQRQGAIGVLSEDRTQSIKLPSRLCVSLVGDQYSDLTFGVIGQVTPAEPTLALASPGLAKAQQTAKPTVGSAIGRIDEHVGAVVENDAAADNQPDANGLCRLMSADDTREAVAIRNGQRREAAGCGLSEELVTGAGASQERKVGSTLEFSVKIALMFSICSHGRSGLSRRDWSSS
jgi:hypothetical protein